MKKFVVGFYLLAPVYALQSQVDANFRIGEGASWASGALCIKTLYQNENWQQFETCLDPELRTTTPFNYYLEVVREEGSATLARFESLETVFESILVGSSDIQYHHRSGIQYSQNEGVPIPMYANQYIPNYLVRSGKLMNLKRSIALKERFSNADNGGVNLTDIQLPCLQLGSADILAKPLLLSDGTLLYSLGVSPLDGLVSIITEATRIAHAQNAKPLSRDIALASIQFFDKMMVSEYQKAITAPGSTTMEQIIPSFLFLHFLTYMVMYEDKYEFAGGSQLMKEVVFLMDETLPSWNKFYQVQRELNSPEINLDMSGPWLFIALCLDDINPSNYQLCQAAARTYREFQITSDIGQRNDFEVLKKLFPECENKVVDFEKYR